MEYAFEVGEKVEAATDLKLEDGTVIPDGTKGVVMDVSELLVTVEFEGYPTADWEPEDLW